MELSLDRKQTCDPLQTMHTCSKPHWLFLDIFLTGHHLEYLVKLAAGAHQAGFDVSIAVCERKSEPQWAVLVDSLLGKAPSVKIHRFSPPRVLTDRGVLGHFNREMSNWTLFKKMFTAVNRSQRVDVVFVPYLDHALNAMGILGSPFGCARVQGVCMRPSFHFSLVGVVAPRDRIGSVKKLLFKRLLSLPTVESIYTIDETLCYYASLQRQACWLKIRYLPDPSDLVEVLPRHLARQRLGLPANKAILLIYGTINERKGIDALIDAFQCERLEDHAVLVVVGSNSARYREFFSGSACSDLRSAGALVVEDRFVSSNEEALYFAAADGVWLGYRNHYGMSGVLIKSVQAGCLSICSNVGLLGWHAARLKDCISIDVNCRAQVRSALKILIEYTRMGGKVSEGAGFSGHSWDDAIEIVFRGRGSMNYR